MSSSWPLVGLIVLSTLMRVVFAATTGLGVDESYMVAAGRTLSLSYFDHPPISWWLSWGSAHLFGSESPIVVRLPFITLFALTQIAVGAITTHISTRKAAFWAVLALNLAPVFGVTSGTWVLPDGPLDAALVIAAASLLFALESGVSRFSGWWVLAGLAAGIALLSKYSALLVIAGALLYLLVTGMHRHWLRRPHPYVAGMVAALAFLPVLVWNAQHHWASFAFQGDRALGWRFNPLASMATLGGEALFVLPWIWVLLMIGLVRGFRGTATWPSRYLACLAIIPIAFFALVAMWSSRRVLFHWAAPGYLMLFPLAGAIVAEWTERRWFRIATRGTVALLAAALVIVMAQLQFDVLGPVFAAELRHDPTVEGLDWRSVRDDLQARGLLRPDLPVAALNWRDGGKFSYALAPGTFLCLNTDSREFGLQAPLAGFAGRDVLIVALGPADQAERQASQWFSKVEVLRQSSIRLRGRVLQPVNVMLGRSLR
jgi:4-amino-4-deoxy-L-arabinose transferase-like glycosyltransferase